MYNDFMLDLETFSLANNAAVIQIACVPFDIPSKSYSAKEAFNIHIAGHLDIAAGGAQDKSTMDFWFKPEQAEALAMIETNQKDPGIALLRFIDFVKEKANPNAAFWTLGCVDFIWLENMFKRHRLKMPFSYRQHCDMRTLIRLTRYHAVEQPAPIEPKHYALSDCYYQIESVFAMLNTLQSPHFTES